MSRRDFTMTIDLMLRTWGPRINTAALAFEARWTRSALRMHDTKLADAFELALAQYETATTSGSSTDIDNAGKRLERAYGVIAARLGSANVPDDAYMVGRDPKTSTEIIVTPSPAAAEYAREHGHRFAAWFSPDEVAVIIGLDARAKKIAAVKAAFPGAEIINVNGGEHDDAD